ncbi:LLM class flavin-dependent oxidoreductase [Aestuariimicrobium kwangyangense]|uniref:LLM class flavin-dependent oxidoreductase n=1 Tax=Aestuariimicrobium kwangyangense TaxID=396389 RepID=UPI0003B38190|nr:LLM class flavin-dependent oxidoreductase [Aestuariimicrobium kwangyangense]
MTAVPLSVLDLAGVSTGQTSADALHGSIRVAQAVDDAGFDRFWVAEHHNTLTVASTSPPVLMATLAERTSRIRIGSGGVMLPNHAPLVVAEQFALLEALHPGRIDLGIGRAPGTDQFTAQALRRSPDGLSVEDFPTHVLQVMAWLGDNRLKDDPLVSRLVATPSLSTSPEVWLLGSSGYSAQLAGMVGLRYCYAHHFGGMDPVTVFELYRSRFEASPALAEPHAMLATSVLTADDAETADYLAGPARVMWQGIRTNRREPIVSPEEAARRDSTQLDELLLSQMPAVKFIGTHDDVVERVRELVKVTGVQELMLTATTFDPQTKIDSFTAFAERWRA